LLICIELFNIRSGFDQTIRVYFFAKRQEVPPYRGVVLNPDNLLQKMATRVGRIADFVGSISRQNYTLGEQLNLLRARRPHNHETNLLNFRVSYRTEGAYRFLVREIFYKGGYVFEAGTDSPVILDCGANIGLATVFFKRLYPNARISSFEADPVTADILRKNVEQNHLQDVSVYNVMLSNTEGEHPFYTVGEGVDNLKMSAHPDRTTNHRKIIVKAGRLSTYFDRPVDLLKLDVEGSEMDVLTDLRNSGKISLVRRMVIEYHHKIGGQASCLAKFLSLLEEEGFEYQISADGCDPITRQSVYQDIIIGAYRQLPN
jgi:FkbM family methyltransferase